MLRALIDPLNTERKTGYFHQGKFIPNDPDNVDFKLIQKEIALGRLQETPVVPVVSFREQRRQECITSFGGCTAEDFLEYICDNGIEAWRAEMARIKALYPEPAKVSGLEEVNLNPK